MSYEHAEAHDHDAPCGWAALSPCRSTAELWGQYSTEITAENDRLRCELGRALQTVSGAVRRQPFFFTATERDTIAQATRVYQESIERQRGRDGGEQ